MAVSDAAITGEHDFANAMCCTAIKWNGRGEGQHMIPLMTREMGERGGKTSESESDLRDATPLPSAADGRARRLT